MTDERTNEQIIAEALAEKFGMEAEYYIEETRIPLAALAAAGRLVTPEHDAQVAGAERGEWADYLERVTGSVGPVPWSVYDVIAALRGPRPFGVVKGGAS